MLTSFLLQEYKIHKLVCIERVLGGPDDDLIRSKHVTLTIILFYGI